MTPGESVEAWATRTAAAPAEGWRCFVKAAAGGRRELSEDEGKGTIAEPRAAAAADRSVLLFTTADEPTTGCGWVRRAAPGLRILHSKHFRILKNCRGAWARVTIDRFRHSARLAGQVTPWRGVCRVA